MTSSTPVSADLIGQEPSAPGNAWFPEASGYRYYDRILYGVTIFLALLGIVCMITLGGPSWMFLVLCVPFAIWGLVVSRKFQHIDCVCDEQGFTLRRLRGGKPQPSTYIPWAQIEKTHCGTFKRPVKGANNAPREYLSFYISAPDQGSVKIQETRIRNFGGLIALANQYTPHLGYVWLPDSEVRGREVLARAKSYCKVAR